MTFAKADAWRDRFAAVPFEDKGGSHPSRYYQDIAVDRVMHAIAANKTAYPTHARHWHGQDIHRVSNRLETFSRAVELKPRGHPSSAHLVFGRQEHLS